MLVSFSVLDVTYWIERDLDEIKQTHGEDIFDSYDSETRRRLNSEELAELELLDDEGMEIPIYSQDGY